MAQLPQSFLAKKQKILQQLAVPVEDYDDLSPKGSVDEGIRDLIGEVNGIEGCVTTSSCAGRISVFLEGQKSPSNAGLDMGLGEDGEKSWVKGAGVGGKGGGGRWLFVTHDPVDIKGSERSLTELLGMQTQGPEEMAILSTAAAKDMRLIHFKFEPMILHVLTASLQHAQKVLSSAIQAGFRESGALNLTSSTTEPPMPMVGIRSMGLALESVVGFHLDNKGFCMIPEPQLRILLRVSNERFKENTKRIKRFQNLLKEMFDEGGSKRRGQDGEVWEDAQVRRERKKAEGLERAQAEKASKLQTLGHEDEELPDIGFLDQNT